MMSKYLHELRAHQGHVEMNFNKHLRDIIEDTLLLAPLLKVPGPI